MPPKIGWRLWSEPDAKLRAYNGTSWTEVYGTAIQNLALLGVDTAADAANPLAMRGPNALFTAKYVGSGGTGDLQVKINKEAATDTGSVLFQTNFSGRAEMGLAGNDNFSLRVSADGSSWIDALTVDRTNGRVSFPSAPGPIIDVTRAPYNAVGNGLADDRGAIQAALDAAGALGGGIVFLPAGTYKISNGLSVPSNTQLMGVGDASVITGPAGAVPGVGVGATTIFALIVSAGTTCARVSRLKIDLNANGTTSNGIQFGEYLVLGATSGGMIEGCTVVFKVPSAHQYGIYGKCADQLKVLNCRVLGPSSGAITNTEGIEIFGCRDVEVSGNYVEKTQGGIYVKTENGVNNSPTADVIVSRNTVEQCATGIYVLEAGGTGNSTRNVLVTDNIVRDCTNRSCNVGAAGSLPLTMENVVIANNHFLNAASQGVAFDNVVGSAVLNVSIRQNTIVQTALNSIAVTLFNVTQSTFIENNNINGGGAGGAVRCVFLQNSSNVIIADNSITNCQQEAIYAFSGSNNVHIVDNRLTQYGLSVATTGVFIDGTDCVVSGNTFVPGAASAAQNYIQAQTAINPTLGWNGSDQATNNTRMRMSLTGRGLHLPVIQDGYNKQRCFTAPRSCGFGASFDTDLTNMVDIVTGQLRIRTPATPATAAAPGNTGEMCWDTNYLYVCTATNTWKRAALSTW